MKPISLFRRSLPLEASSGQTISACYFSTRIGHLLTAIALLIGCSGKTLDIGTANEAQPVPSEGGADTRTTADAGDCRNQPLPPVSEAPASVVGTWLIDSFDDTDSGSSPGNALHVTVDRGRPILAVTFKEDGTWTAAHCISNDRYDTCSAWCDGALTCTSGIYTYDNGLLESEVANRGPLSVSTTATGLAINYFYGTLGWTNLVVTDALPSPCQ